MRLLDFLEPVRGLFIIRILVRMMHYGQLPVRFLDLSLRSILLDAENLVVVLSFALLQFQFRISNLLR